MWEELFRWIHEINPTLGWVTASIVMLLVGYRLYHLWEGRVKKVEWEQDKINEKIDQGIIPRLNSIDVSMNSLVGSVNGLAKSFNSLIAYLAAKDPTIIVFISKSPIEIGPDGMRILEASGGKFWIDFHSDLLIKELEKAHYTTALDVQINAPKIIISLSTCDDFNGIKNYIYNNPYYKQTPESEPIMSAPITLDSVTNIMGVYLRNIYLEKHPELKPKEESAHD